MRLPEDRALERAKIQLMQIPNTVLTYNKKYSTLPLTNN
jgi:hypothetical protein